MDKIESITKRFNELKTRSKNAEDNKTRITTVLDMRRKALKDQMQACRDQGYNPEMLEHDINRDCEVLDIKISNADADLKVAEEIMAPMLKEIG